MNKPRRKAVVTISVFMMIIIAWSSSVAGSFSSSTIMSSFGKIVPGNSQSRYVATLLITWNEYYFDKDPNWSQKALFTPVLGSYQNNNKTIIDQQIRLMEFAGIDICFVTVDYMNAVYWMNLFMNEAASLNSTVKFAAYLNGSNFSNSTGNLALTGVTRMNASSIFTNPEYFKYDGHPVVSGYLSSPQNGCNATYWVDVKTEFPFLSIWADGWYPDYWNSLDGTVDAMSVFDFSQNANTQVNYYLTAEKHPVSIHVFPITAGFDDSGINGTMPKLNRDNGTTYINCWKKIPSLTTKPNVVWIGTWNDYGECSGIEPIVASRSTTTSAFGELYLNLTRYYSSLFENGLL